ncbi:MAG: transposase [Syntrophorhabdus sp.]|nr:transposase [Syntrophorhabdus sp.]
MGAVIIFDKFHIINILNAATGEVCKREIRRCSSVQSIYE